MYVLWLRQDSRNSSVMSDLSNMSLEKGLNTPAFHVLDERRRSEDAESVLKGRDKRQ